MTATSVEQPTTTFAVGDTVEILRLQDPKNTTYNGTEAPVVGLSAKGWLKLKCHDGKIVTLKPDWVSLKSSAPAVTEAESEVAEDSAVTENEVDVPKDSAVTENESEVDSAVTETEPEIAENSTPEPEVSYQDKSTGYFKFSCNSTVFAKALAQVRRVIRQLSIHPILNNVKITADAKTKRVELVGFDLSLGVIVDFIATEVPVGGSYTVTVAILHDILYQLPEGTVTLERNESSDKAKLTTANGVFEISGKDAYDYPELPIPKQNLKKFKLSTKAMRVGLGSTLYAASTDPTKLVLTGAHFVVTPDHKLEIAATDGHRLALYRCEINFTSQIQNPQHLTIPARTLREAERYLTKDESMVEISYEADDSGTSIVQIELEEATIVGRVLEGDYPKYDSLIPKKFQREVWVERLPLIGSVSRVSVLSDYKNNLIKMSVESKKVVLSSENEEAGSGTEAVPAELSGEDIKIAFNVKYISEALKSIGTQEVAIKINQKATPVIIVPLNGYDIVALIMPVQIRE
ncbi:MAG: DNA polymerase III subunit beta [Nostoc sp. SerVER01]|nr:DNA polymerase III subunit beta [Nostoc sp. SerVER01]